MSEADDKDKGNQAKRDKTGSNENKNH